VEVVAVVITPYQLAVVRVVVRVHIKMQRIKLLVLVCLVKVLQVVLASDTLALLLNQAVEAGVQPQ
jgi:hypothetical protein